MPRDAGFRNLRDELNRMTPGARDAFLGDVVYDLINMVNQQAAQINGLLAHLDTANVAGIGNANAATYGIAGTVALPEDR